MNEWWCRRADQTCFYIPAHTWHHAASSTSSHLSAPSYLGLRPRKPHCWAAAALAQQADIPSCLSCRSWEIFCFEMMNCLKRKHWKTFGFGHGLHGRGCCTPRLSRCWNRRLSSRFGSLVSWRRQILTTCSSAFQFSYFVSRQFFGDWCFHSFKHLQKCLHPWVDVWCLPKNSLPEQLSVPFHLLLRPIEHWSSASSSFQISARLYGLSNRRFCLGVLSSVPQEEQSPWTRVSDSRPWP